MKLGVKMLPSSYPHARVGQVAPITKARERQKKSMMPACMMPEPSASDSSIIPAHQPLETLSLLTRSLPHPLRGGSVAAQVKLS